MLDETKKELYTHLLDNILKEINEVSSLSASEFNDYLLKEGITYPKNANQNYLNLSISSQFTIHILNKLYAIYLPLNIGVQELKSLYKSSNDIMRSLK